MAFTKVETPGLKGYSKVSIRPYFDPSIENMGLENYGLALHDGVYHTEQLCCLENNGIKRYVTGLNEFAPEVKGIKDEKKRKAKIKEIRKVVADLEATFAANIIDPDDKEFWNKVQLLKPDNDEFWSKIELKAGNDILFMDPSKDPYDLIKLYAIDAGGFSIVAKSLQAARDSAKSPKFYLDRAEETVTTKNASKKLKNKAVSMLEDMFNKDTNKLLYVAKVIHPASSTFKKSTSNDVIYGLMDDYIMGAGVEKNPTIAAEHFIDVADESIGDLKLRAMIKDASFNKIIAAKPDGYIYHTSTATMLGKNPSDILEYLKNPMNEEVLVAIQEVIEDNWNS
jgi:hypothetical protein